MHSTKTVYTEQSKLYPGVSFKIRTLNVMKRAQRDAGIASQRLEYTRLSAERATQFKALGGDTGTIEEQTARVNALPIEKRLEILRLDEEADSIFNQFILPATIRAAFVSIDGYELDGATPDIDALLNDAPDDLLGEIYAACVRGSGLTEGEAKN